MRPKLSLIELFSGIGAQRRALINTELFDIENVAVSEIDKEALVSYAIIHCGLTKELLESYTDYPTQEEMAKELSELNIGYDFEVDKPFNWQRYITIRTNDIRRYWLANKLCGNLGDISRIKVLPYADVVTFSAPCTDISVQGNLKGMTSGETRSGLIWEILRLLDAAKAQNTLPKYLLMENVKNLAQQFINDFNALNDSISEYGYTVYWQVLTADYCGIPQNRERVFALYIRNDIDTGKFWMPKPFDVGLNYATLLDAEPDITCYRSYQKLHNTVLAAINNHKLSRSNAKKTVHKITDMPSVLHQLRKGKLTGKYTKSFKKDYTELNCEIRSAKIVKAIATTSLSTLRTIQGCGDKHVIEFHPNGTVKIRYLSVYESFKLMGFTERDVDKCLNEGVSRSNLYHQAGNSIVTMCIQLMFEHVYRAIYDDKYITLDMCLSELPYDLKVEIQEYFYGKVYRNKGRQIELAQPIECTELAAILNAS